MTMRHHQLVNWINAEITKARISKFQGAEQNIRIMITHEMRRDFPEPFEATAVRNN